MPGGFLLTSNRDEDPGRKTGAPEKVVLPGGRGITTPRDLEKGGSWIAMDDTGQVSCLLNGAFSRHQRRPSYRMSRGQLVFEAFEAASFEAFAVAINLEDIEPFTLLFAGPGQLQKLVWDGSRKYHWELPADSVHLWSSPTLYSPVQHAGKERYFKEALMEAPRSPEAVLKIHGKEGNTPFILSRTTVRTVSITQIHTRESAATMEYIPKKNIDEKTVSVHIAV